jgi:hypothetical protein
MKFLREKVGFTSYVSLELQWRIQAEDQNISDRRHEMLERRRDTTAESRKKGRRRVA